MSASKAAKTQHPKPPAPAPTTEKGKGKAGTKKPPLAQPTKSPAPRRAPAAAPASTPVAVSAGPLAKGTLRVRMYRVGFGDAFLVSLPRAAGGHDHILIDCGVLQKADLNRLEAVIGNIVQESGSTLAVIIGTHEHQDHLAAFRRFPALFQPLVVGEVWLPWTSNRADPKAAQLRGRQVALASALTKRFGARETAGAQSSGNALQNDASIDVLLHGLSGPHKPQYLADGTILQSAAGIAGLTAHILGPPDDPALLPKMNPPKSNHYFGDEEADGEPVVPFDDRWVVTPYGLSGSDLADLHEQLETSPELLAAALDNCVNNTSVVALLSFGKERLLFAGDAQWGNWQNWTANAEGKELLSQVTFYKVGHHGSYNATPKDALEAMPKNRFVAMMSTLASDAHMHDVQSLPKAPYPTIPPEALVDALNDLTGNQLARSDQDAVPARFVAAELWIDYLVEGVAA